MNHPSTLVRIHCRRARSHLAELHFPRILAELDFPCRPRARTVWGWSCQTCATQRGITTVFVNVHRAHGCTVTFACGHTASNAPDPIRTRKLSGARPGQYWGGGPPGKPFGCRKLFLRLFDVRKMSLAVRALFRVLNGNDGPHVHH